MKKIIIIGATGSGKTTLGTQMSAKIGIPAIDLDEIRHLPEWRERDIDEARRMVDAATQQTGWVVSGNFKKVHDIFWPRADTLIWLDYPFFTVFRRLLRRSICRIMDQHVICNGNHETWGKFFSSDSIMLWLFRTYLRRKREFGEIFSHPEQYPHLMLVRLKNPAEAEIWLKNIKAAS